MISVIIPVYNTEKYIRRCIDSVLGQSFTDYEVILIDDGSTDSSGQICDEYVEENIRVSCIHNANGGLSKARNKGLEVARGEYIAFLDSDDYMHKHMLTVLHDSIIKTKAGLAMCAYRSVPVGAPDMKLNLSDYSFRILNGNDLIDELYGPDGTSVVVAWNKLYKRQIFEKIRYPEKRLHEDEFVIHEILDKCGSVICTDAPLYNYVQREGALTETLTYDGARDKLDAIWSRLQYYSGRKYVYALRKTCKLWEYLIFDLYKRAEGTEDCREIRRCVKAKLKENLPYLEKVKLISKEKATEYRLWLVNSQMAKVYRKLTE